jgi:hypothetical protein
MTARGPINKNPSLINHVADWSAALAAIALVLGVVLATVRVAPAQTGAPQAPTLQRPAIEAEKPGSTLPSTGETRSERLDRSEGVIKPPPGVDPEIRVPPKDSSAGANMPVIPPPAGGFQPK